jgi:hypothetical protein
MCRNVSGSTWSADFLVLSESQDLKRWTASLGMISVNNKRIGLTESPLRCPAVVQHVLQRSQDSYDVVLAIARPSAINPPVLDSSFKGRIGPSRQGGCGGDHIQMG